MTAVSRRLRPDAFNFRAAVNDLVRNRGWRRPMGGLTTAILRRINPFKRYRANRKRASRGPLFCCLAGVDKPPGRPHLTRLLEERITALIAPVVVDEGFELVRVKISGRETLTLQVMAERADKTMTAEDCARLSRALSVVLEEADPTPGAYRLEVSSPGIDRPLTRLKDFDDWQGYEAKLELDRMIEGRKRFHGVLAGVEGGNVLLDIDGEDDTAFISFDWIANARLVLTDELVRESLRAAEAAKKETDSELQSGEHQ